MTTLFISWLTFRELLKEVTDEIYWICQAHPARSRIFLPLLLKHWHSDRDPELYEWIQDSLTTDLKSCENGYHDPRTHESYDWNTTFSVEKGPVLDESVDRPLLDFLVELRVLKKYCEMM